MEMIFPLGFQEIDHAIGLIMTEKIRGEHFFFDRLVQPRCPRPEIGIAEFGNLFAITGSILGMFPEKSPQIMMKRQITMVMANQYFRTIYMGV
jgi:hypothetical protein